MAFVGPIDVVAVRRTRRVRVATIALGVLLVLWIGRARLLTAIGDGLVSDDPLMPAEVIVTSLASVRADALETARLYRDGLGRRVVIARWQQEPLDDEILRLGVPWVPPHELAVAVLEKSGVPPTAIELLDDAVDGLNTEISAIARFANATPPASLLYVTARSHGRRARWLLHRLLPERTMLIVRASTDDQFHPDAWWQSRSGSREVAMEYLRWANSFGLRDFWHREPPSVPEPVD